MLNSLSVISGKWGSEEVGRRERGDGVLGF